MRHPEICLQTLDATPWVISRIAIASCMTSQDTEMNKHDAWIFLGNLKDSKSHGKLPIEFHDFPIKTLHLYRGYSHVFSCFAITGFIGCVSDTKHCSIRISYPTTHSLRAAVEDDFASGTWGTLARRLGARVPEKNVVNPVMNPNSLRCLSKQKCKPSQA